MNDLKENAKRQQNVFTRGQKIQEEVVTASFEISYLIMKHIDESTDRTDIAQTSLFLRACLSDMTVIEELLEVIPLHDTTTGEDILDAVWKVLEENQLPLEKLVSVTTDGAPSITGKTKGFVALLSAKLKEKFPKKPSLNSFHCLIHQEVLCSKSLKMDRVVKEISKIVIYIRARGLNHRQFKSFLAEMDSEFEDLPYYTEVRWLSCHKVLQRFNALLEEVKLFLEMKGEDVTLMEDLNWRQDVTFLVDITGHLQELNLKLQGVHKLINKVDEILSNFITRLLLWTNQLKKDSLIHFPTCKIFIEKKPKLQFCQIY